MEHRVKAVSLAVPKDHHTERNPRYDDFESMEGARRNKASIPRILLRLFPYDRSSQLEFESPLLIDNKFFFKFLYSKQKHTSTQSAHSTGHGNKGSEDSLLSTENLKIMEIIHYAEENVMRLTINKENRKFCVMGREDSIWKSLGVKAETWEDSITIRIGYRGQDYEFQVHKVRKAIVTSESTCCPSNVISPVTKQEGLIEKALELTHEVPNGGVLKSSMAKSQSISMNSSKSSTFKDGSETPSKLGFFGLRLDRVTSMKSTLSEQRFEQSSGKQQVSGSSGSSDKSSSARLSKQMDKFLNSWRACSDRPNLRQSIAFLEKELMQAECQLLERPLVRTITWREEIMEGLMTQTPRVRREANQDMQTYTKNLNSEEAGTLELDMGFIWGDSQDSLESSVLKMKKDLDSSKLQNQTHQPKDSNKCSGSHHGSHPACSHSKKKESPSKSGPRSHKQLKEATDEKLCQFVLEKRDPKQLNGGQSASKPYDILAELAFLEQQEDERIRKASGDTHLTNGNVAASDNLKEQQNLQDEIQGIGCSICYMAETDMHERGQLDCGHRFCFDCIRDWSKVTNLCPLCKRAFLKIAKTIKGIEGSETIQVESKAVDLDELLQEPVLENAEDHCYACEEEEDEDQMLVCDHCLTKCCHIFCLSPPLDHIPYEPWYCDFCIREHNLRTTLPQANFFGPRRRRRAPLLEDDDDDEGSIPGVVSQPQLSTNINSRQQAARPQPRANGTSRGPNANNRRNQTAQRSQDDEDDAWLAEASNSRTIRIPARNRRSSRTSSDSEPQAPANLTYRRNPDLINNRQALHDFRDQRRQSRQQRAQPAPTQALSRQASGRGQPGAETLGLERFPHTVTARTFPRANQQLHFDHDAFDDEFS